MSDRVVSGYDWSKNEIEYLSECCDAYPTWELDMSTTNFGGPSGFCSRCLDNTIFFLACSNCGSSNQVSKINSIFLCIDCSKEEVGVS